MSIKIALAGNPNCGKTTLFNALTGSNQFVGNWPGVTVEKKEGRLKGNKDVTIMDLPGIYSLSPYTLEEVVARNYLINEKPDAILNIVDGTNIERNLYLSTQIMELGIPVIMAVNMMDLVEKSGDKIHIEKLSKSLGCEVVEISALKGTGIKEAAQRAVALAQKNNVNPPVHEFAPEVEAVIKEAEGKLGSEIPEEQKRFFAIKLLERDNKITEQMKSVPDVSEEIAKLEESMDDDTESIITNERYTYISSIIDSCCTKNKRNKLSVSDKIDHVVTNRWAAIPIFAAIMALVYFISMSSVGAWGTDWVNDSVFGDGFHLVGIGASDYSDATDAYTRADQIVAAVEDDETTVEIKDEEENVLETVAINTQVADEAQELVDAGEPDPADYGVWIPGIPTLVGDGLDAIGCADWLSALIKDGIVAGVGSVLGFVPQMLVLFALLAFLEACGYMARVAFIMDRIFRKFGLSGKSFIPMLIGSGCGVPGIMASRTIENDRDRKMTIMTTTFIPCSAKMPIIALIAGAVFDGSFLVAVSAYFVGVVSIICSGIILKKTKMFAGDPAPFVMELPAYHMPTVSNILRSMWERGSSFIKKAGTIILLSTILIWFTKTFGWVDGAFTMLEEDQLDSSILSAIGGFIAPIFAPLGWGDWKMAVATVTGLVAKEGVVGTFGVLFGFGEVAEDGIQIWSTLGSTMTAVAAYSFLVFNLLCAPCFAAMGAIKREMNSAKWFWFAIGYQTIFAYIVALCVYQIGTLISTGAFGFGTVVAFLLIAAFLYLLFRPYKESKTLNMNVKTAVNAK